MQNRRRITTWWSATSLGKNNSAKTNLQDWEVVWNKVGSAGGQGYRKTFPDSVTPLFCELPQRTADVEEKRRLFKADVMSLDARVCGEKKRGSGIDV